LADAKTTFEIVADHRTSMDATAPLTYPFKPPADYAEMVEVADGILWFRMPLPFSLDHINLYLLKDGDGWAILDSGLSTSMVKDLWLKILNETIKGEKITKIIITHYHPDHMGCAGWLHEQTGAPIHMTALEMLTGRTLKSDVKQDVPDAVVKFYERAGFDEEQISFLINMGFGNFAKVVSDLPIGYVRMKGGDRLVVGKRKYRVLIGSGHSPEHACLYCEDEKILISGDQVLPKITSNVSVYPTEPLANPLHDWLESLKILSGLDSETLVLPAHNEVFLGLHKRVDEIGHSHLRRLKSVVELCATPKTAVEAFGALFKRKLKGFDMIMGLGESLAHLHYLENLGVVERDESGNMTKFLSVASFDKTTI
jgi:glyoxylase-like metal-dependent hydrolase (beta-lactamase superfamily II)